jgi:hypothetical protein
MKTQKIYKAKDRFLPLKVYQFPLGNCGGITDSLTKESIYIPCADGHVYYEDIENDDLIFTEEQRGTDYWALSQVNQPKGMLGPMSGGNIAYSSDSRCKRMYHIHDRFETQEQYNILSR